MLTNSQDGMLKHWLSLEIGTLVHYFIEDGKDKNGYKKIMQILQEAYDNENEPNIELITPQTREQKPLFNRIPTVIDHIKKILETIKKNDNLQFVKNNFEAIATKFNWNKINEEYLQFFNQCLERNSRGATVK